ncbi:MAG: hypothetical protein AAF936_12935 [Pseudomonadota bacterium]
MSDEKTQSEKFKALAREAECDEDETAFDKNLKRIAEAPQPKKQENKALAKKGR